MVSYTLLVFCVQVCLLQTAFTQYIGPGIGPGAPGHGFPNGLPGHGFPGIVEASLAAGIGPLGLETYGLGSYGGAGVGEVNVIGELPVAGSTVVAGQVPILGAVEFSGVIPAGGIVSVTGTCSCGNGFNAPFVY